MAINKKLIFWKSATFNPPTSSTDTTKDVLWSSIVFFDSTAGTYANSIWTHGQVFSAGAWGTNQTNYVPLTLSGTTYNLSKDGHTHSYLPLNGGIMTSNILFNTTATGIDWSMNTDMASIKFYNTGDGDTDSRLQFTIGDNSNEYFSWRTSAGTELLKLLPSDSTNGLTFRGNNVWHAGNSNLSSVNWATNTLTASTVTSDRITGVKLALGDIRNNLGDPTVEEMALFHGQFNNKFRFISPTSQEESTDGTTWVASTRASANQLGDLMIGEGQSGGFSAIPEGTVGTYGGYRLTWDVYSITGYICLNYFYVYNSTSGNTVTFKIDAYHNTNGWGTIASGTANNWPGHTVLKHNAIWYSANATQYSKVRVTFETTRSNTYPVVLYGIEWFGGYPAGRRNAEYYDRNKNVTFPAAVYGTTFYGNLSGTATSATSATSAGKWTSARTVTFGTGDISGSFTIDGSADVSNVNLQVADNSHNHTSLTGVTSLTFAAPSGDPSPTITSRVVPTTQGGANEKSELILFHSNDGVNGSGVDQITLRAPGLSFQTYTDSGVSTISADAGYNERLYIAPNGAVTISQTLAVTNGITADLTGNALTATTWKSARTLTIGASGKSVNGAGDVSWSLAEIGAAESVHTHNYLPLVGGNLTGAITISNQAAINTTTPGTQLYGLHFLGQSTSDYATGITWNGGTTGAQAGIYVQGSGSYGTKMYIATTDAYVSGSKTAISIDHTGLVNFERVRPKALGNLILDVGNYSSYALPLGGGILTGQLEISNDAPTIKFSDSTSGAHDFWIHVNSDTFYILTDRNNDGNWDGNHPAAFVNSDASLYIYGNKALDTGNYSTYALPLSGGTMTGSLNFKNGTWNNVGDDVAIGDVNVAGQLGIKTLNSTIPGIAFYNNSNAAIGNLTSNAGTLQWSGSTVWHSSNDGSGSGLDADTLDTLHSSDYVSKSYDIVLSQYNQYFYMQFAQIVIPSGTTSLANSWIWYMYGYEVGDMAASGHIRLSIRRESSNTVGSYNFSTFNLGTGKLPPLYVTSDDGITFKVYYKVPTKTGYSGYFRFKTIQGTNVLTTSGTHITTDTLPTGTLYSWTAVEANSQGYITGNQTISLTGIITGSGTTSIATAIADSALSIAKTSGLQTALDGKLSLTGSSAMTGELKVTLDGRAASFGVNANAPNSSIATQTNYIQIVANGATESMGLVFHNVGVSTSALEYVNTDVNTGYFNFKSDDTTWNARINNNVIWHAGNDGAGTGLDADLLDGYQSTAFLRPYHSNSDFVNGTLVQTNIPSNTTDGASFILEATGKSYSGTYPPFSFIIQGYLYNNTIINYSGSHITGYGFDQAKILDNGGTLAFWWPRVSYWNSFQVIVRDAGDTGTVANRVTTITDSAEPASSKKVTVTMIKNISSANYNSYALPLSGGTLTGNLKITPVSEAWAEGLSFIMPTTWQWGGIRWQRQRSSNDGNWAFGYTGLDSTDDLVFASNNNGSQVDNIIRLTKTGNVGIGIPDPGLYKLYVNGNTNIQGNITISGTVSTTSNITASNLWPVRSKTITLTLTTSWQDSGILLNDSILFTDGNGTYMIEIYTNAFNVSYLYQMRFSGIMAVYTGATNSTESDEIMLHSSGHASNNRTIYARTVMQLNGTTYTKLQLSCSADWSGAGDLVIQTKRIL